MASFIAALILITIIYLVVWKVGKKRDEAIEMQRRQVLAEKTNSRNMRIRVERAERRASVAAGY